MRNHLNPATTKAASWRETRERLLPILGHLGFAPFEAYCVLWTLCDLRPSDITVTKEDLAAPLKRDARRALDWMEELQRVGLVDIIDREAQRNTFRLYVYEPEVVSQPRKRVAEPQAELFDEAAQPAQTIAAVSVPKPPAVSAGSAVSVPKPPATPTAGGAQLALWGEDEQPGAETAAAEVAPKPPYMHEDMECGPDISGEHSFPTRNSCLTGSPAETKNAPPLKTVSIADDEAETTWGNRRELFTAAIVERIDDAEFHPTNARRAFDCIDGGFITDDKVWSVVDGAVADFGTERGRDKQGRQLSRGEMFVGRMKGICKEFARMIEANAGFGRQRRRPKLK